tara:strand:- start:451 stop:1035 length:585 start_codon:yes stop_codon:yes gene_type:complete
MVSLFKIAEKCQVLLGKGDIQSLISSVKDAYATIVQKEFYENKADGDNSIAGEHIYTFGKKSALTPILDITTDEYYIINPSSFISLPHQIGIQWVSFVKDKRSWIEVSNWGLWQDLKASILGNNNTFRIEGIRIYFPRMTNASVGDILLKMVVALDEVDSRENLNISANIQDQIVSMVVAKFAPREKPIPTNLA